MCRPLCDGLPGTCRAGAPPGCPGGVREWGAATQTPSQLQDWRTHCPPCLPGFSPQSVLETVTPPPGQTRTIGLTPPTAASLSAKCPFPFKEETGTKSFQSPTESRFEPRLKSHWGTELGCRKPPAGAGAVLLPGHVPGAVGTGGIGSPSSRCSEPHPPSSWQQQAGRWRRVRGAAHTGLRPGPEPSGPSPSSPPVASPGCHSGCGVPRAGLPPDGFGSHGTRSSLGWRT